MNEMLNSFNKFKYQMRHLRRKNFTLSWDKSLVEIMVGQSNDTYLGGVSIDIHDELRSPQV